MSYNINQPIKYQPENEQVTYTNPFNRRKTIVELWNEPIGQFTIRAGADSEYSYSGFIEGVASMNEMKEAIQTRYATGKLFR
jgi:hypothetical protein